VDHGINMAYTLFIQGFENIDTFCQIPKTERVKFLKALIAYEIHLTPQNQLIIIGFCLFERWVGVLNGDDELISQFSEELKYFSRKSDSAITRDSLPYTFISFASNVPHKKAHLDFETKVLQSGGTSMSMNNRQELADSTQMRIKS